jgi:hypothetical protein
VVAGSEEIKPTLRLKSPNKGDGTMKIWLSLTVTACLVLAPVASHAATTQKHHHTHVHRSARAPGSVFDPTGGNAALGGNTASSMSGSHSAPENDIGRSNGGGMGR